MKQHCIELSFRQSTQRLSSGPHLRHVCIVRTQTSARSKCRKLRGLGGETDGRTKGETDGPVYGRQGDAVQHYKNTQKKKRGEKTNRGKITYLVHHRRDLLLDLVTFAVDIHQPAHVPELVRYHCWDDSGKAPHVQEQRRLQLGAVQLSEKTKRQEKRPEKHEAREGRNDRKNTDSRYTSDFVFDRERC